MRFVRRISKPVIIAPGPTVTFRNEANPYSCIDELATVPIVSIGWDAAPSRTPMMPSHLGCLVLCAWG